MISPKQEARPQTPQSGFSQPRKWADLLESLFQQGSNMQREYVFLLVAPFKPRKAGLQTVLGDSLRNFGWRRQRIEPLNAQGAGRWYHFTGTPAVVWLIRSPFYILAMQPAIC